MTLEKVLNTSNLQQAFEEKDLTKITHKYNKRQSVT